MEEHDAGWSKVGGDVWKPVPRSVEMCGGGGGGFQWSFFGFLERISKKIKM